MKLLRKLVFHRYLLSSQFFRSPHLIYFRWNPWEVRSFIVIFWVWNFQKSTLSTFSIKLLRSLVFHRYFSSVKFIRGLYLVHFDETLEKFDLSSIFPKSGIFQRYRLNSNLIKLLRWSDLHRCILNVDFSRGSHLVYFNETFEKFRRSSIVSKCGFFYKSTLSTFSMKPLKSLVLHRYFMSVEFLKGPPLVHYWWNFEKFGLSSIFSKCGIFQRSTLSTFTMELLRSWNLHWYFLSSEFLRGPHLVHSRWNSWENWSFIDIF